MRAWAMVFLHFSETASPPIQAVGLGKYQANRICESRVVDFVSIYDKNRGEPI